jgi:thiol:disulfide interchange protein DsbA
MRYAPEDRYELDRALPVSTAVVQTGSPNVNKAISVLAAVFLLAAGSAVAKPFQEGVQYVPIQPQPAMAAGDQVEVIEFFWYGCPHCRDFEPTMLSWAAELPNNVTLVQMPVMFGGPADLHAQMYYALEGMGELERLHGKIFDAMHVDKRDLKTRAAVDAFLEENGVDMAQFDEAMGSFAVAAKANRARALMRRYGVRSVPSLVVDGRYRTGTGFNSYEEITEVIDHVVDKVVNQRQAQAAR